MSLEDDHGADKAWSGFKTSMENTIKHTVGCALHTYKFTPDKFTYENECKPKELNSDGKTTSFKFAANSQPKSGGFDVTETVKHSPDAFGDAKLFFTGEF